VAGDSVSSSGADTHDATATTNEVTTAYQNIGFIFLIELPS
jgi:hypothetical protein